MEQFGVFPALLNKNNNKSLNSQAVTKKELPKYQAEQNPTYQIGSLRKETNKKLFDQGDSLVDKLLSRSRIKLSSSQTLVLDGVKTEFYCQTLLNNFVEKTFQKFTSLYLTLLVYLQLWF